MFASWFVSAFVASVILIAAASAAAVVTPDVPGTGQSLRVLFFVAPVFIACAAGVRVFAASTS